MFTLKRSAAALAAAVAVLSALTGIVCGGMPYASAAAAPVIVIDAGHGGIDAGVRGKQSGVKESDINLAIARTLYGKFTDAGFCAVLTRKSQAGLYGLPVKGFKLRDMQKRREIIKNCGADMVISVHQNFYPDGTRRGAQVFFRKGSESGKRLAICVQERLNAMPSATNSAQPLIGDYYMLQCTEAPSVIVECGFLSNAEDERLLLTEEYREDVAYAVFAGAVNYFT